MKPEQSEALKQLVNALATFLDSGWQSEGSGNANDPHAGMDPDDLVCESVEPGGEIHTAVCTVQPFYGRGLPAPDARNTWRELQRVCRHETDPYKRQNEAHHHAGNLLRWAKQEEKQQLPPVPLGVEVEGKPQTAMKYLTSWREILIALEFKNNREDKQKVSRLNKSYSGPIEIPGQGKQPFVDKAKLLEWWAGLETKVREDSERQRNAQATASNQHDFGRDGKVTPDISGGIKKRRRDRKP
jgi:hypothetical protein